MSTTSEFIHLATTDFFPHLVVLVLMFGIPIGIFWNWINKEIK